MPRGDFLKLLLADTKERQAIFRELFQTGRYQILQEKLKEETGKLRDACARENDGVQQYIRDLSCEQEDPLAPLLEQARAGRLPMPEVEELADRLIRQDQRLQREAAERLAETEERLEEISRELGKAEAREKAEEELEQAKAALAACGEKLAAAAKWQRFQQEKKPEVKKLQEEAARIRADFPGYQELEDKERLLRKTEEELTKGKEAQQELQDKQERQARLLAGMRKSRQGWRAPVSRGNGCCVSRKRPVRKKRPLQDFGAEACAKLAYRSWGRSFRRRRRSTGQLWKRRNGWVPSTREKTGRFWMSRQGFWQKDWRREEPARSAAPFTIPLPPESRKGAYGSPASEIRGSVPKGPG